MDALSSREADLQRLLASERMRCEQHMLNYQTLKDEYNRLQEELTSVHEQLKQAVEQNRQVKESDDAYIAKLQQEISRKDKEIEELKRKTDTSNVAALKKQFLEEAEEHYNKITTDLEKEIDSYREKYSHLHYENTVLKCDLQYREAEHLRAVQEINIKHFAEIKQLKEKAEAVIESRRPLEDDGFLKLREANKEISQLKIKLSAVLKECEEVRAQKEKIALQLDTVTRDHAKQIAENVANIRQLESEKMKTEMQSESLQKELSSCLDHRKKITAQLQVAREEVSTLQGQLEDAEHSYQLKISDLQVEMSRHKGQYEAEKELLSDDLRKVKLELKLLEDELNSQKQIFMEKEQSLRAQLQDMNEQSLEKHRAMESEKKKLEQMFKEMEMSKTERIAQLQQELQSMNLKLQAALETNITNEKQLMALREKLKEISDQSYEDATRQNAALKDVVAGLKEKVNFLEVLNKELKEKNEKLLNEVASYKQAEEAHKVAEVESLLQQHLDWEQKKSKFQQNIVDLERRLKDQNHAAQMEKKELQNKLKTYARLINKLRNKLEVQKAQIEELEINAEILKKNVPLEDYAKVKRELVALQKKQEEFHQIMVTAVQCPSTVGCSPVISSTKLLDRKMPFTPLPAQMATNSEVLLASCDVMDGNKHEEEITKQVRSSEASSSRRQRRRRRRKIRTDKTKISAPSESSSDLENL